jgi:hypothetical protein
VQCPLEDGDVQLEIEANARINALLGQ